ncbi:MAG: IS630 family transposase [Mucilaginibacter sp.]
MTLFRSTTRIPKEKIDHIRKLYIAGPINRSNAAKEVGVAVNTVMAYVHMFRKIERDHPGKIHDFDFYPTIKQKEVYNFKREIAISLFPSLMADEIPRRITAKYLFEKYHVIEPHGYNYHTFLKYYNEWIRSNETLSGISKYQVYLTKEDLATLKTWRKSDDHRHWKIAVILDAAANNKPLTEIGKKVECSHTSILKWIELFKTKGLDGLARERPLRHGQDKQIKDKIDNLVHLVQQSPKNYGIDSPTWMFKDLKVVFTREYGIPISESRISVYFKRRGLRFKKSKVSLSSPDPLYKQKFAEIQRILETLGEKEKFFSIDEYGPCAIRPKGGNVLSMPAERPMFKEIYKSRGWFICTCALELSTNQITHFYSLTKNTAEMIKLLDILSLQYKDQDKIYLSWDAASWHSSKKLVAHVECVNSDDYRNVNHTPLVALAPLPSSSQYLNVIESVFSGLAKSVIHNSDYESVDECKSAIDRYFIKRNNYYLENPKRAGNRIWGKERVKPVFDKANLCKMPGSW